jgi:crotonobetainyl-CoA:carnitine CoA-transferase CaiB-like acyl-CoA transferase
MTAGPQDAGDGPAVLPLSGVRVVDLTRNLAGPYCSMMLGDMGAEVIKIEPPNGGDEMRNLFHFPGRPRDAEDYFGMFNRNKRSMTLDLKSDRGKDIFRRLLAKSEIFVQNLAPGAVDRLGFGWDVVHELNSRMICVNISGFGVGDARRAYDGVVQAASGLMDLTGLSDGPPLQCGLGLADLSTGIFAAFSAVGALRRAEQTGQGVRIDVAMMDALMALHTNPAGSYLASGQYNGRHGNYYPHRVPSEVYETADQRYVLLMSSDSIWPRLCQALDLKEIQDSPKFATNRDRVAHREELNSYIRPRVLALSADQLCGRLLQNDVPHSLVATLPEALESEYAKERAMVITIGEPFRDGRPPIRTMGFPYKMSEGQPRIRFGPPRLGEANDYVTDELLGLPPTSERP